MGSRHSYPAGIRLTGWTLAPLTKDTARAEMIARVRKLRGEIADHFGTIAHWNDRVRAADEEPIDPDPDGQLQRIADGLDRTLAAEVARANAGQE